MSGKYQLITEMAAEHTMYITGSVSRYLSFLDTAAQNYKYRFQDQVLIHAQKPTATACAEIELWNRLGRWVNKGTKGIALLTDREMPYKLRFVFDVSDTNSFAGREINLWQMEQRYEPEVSEALTNSFGQAERGRDFGSLLAAVAALAVQDNLPDYLADLRQAKAGSLLEELDELNTQVWLRSLLTHSVAYMVLSRCGYDPRDYFTAEDFARVIDFNTPETVSVLGTGTSDIAQMLLREIGVTVKALQKAEINQNRTFANLVQPVYNDSEDPQTLKNERSNDYGTDLHPAGRLPHPQPDRSGEPADREIWDAAQKLPDGEPAELLHGSASVRKLNRHLEEIDSQANQMMEQLTKQMSQAQNITERLKAENQLLWVQRMNNIRASAEEIVLRDLIYS